MKLSKDGCIDTEKAFQFLPMGMRSVYKYQACVDPDKQNMQMINKFEAHKYSVKAEAEQTGITFIYRKGIRTGVDGSQGQIGVRAGFAQKRPALVGNER